MTPLSCSQAPQIAFWLVDIDSEASAADAAWSTLLSAEERAQADRFHFERDTRRYRASHAALRTLLSQATGVPAPELGFVQGAFGKPGLARSDAPCFNMSHSGGWALIAIGGTVPIGVDIEVPRPMDDLHALAERNFTPAECEALAASPGPRQLETFLRCWTRKEACLKALGSGLSVEPGVFAAGVEPGLRDTHIDVAGQRCRMSVVSLALPVQAQAAVAWLSPADRHLAM